MLIKRPDPIKPSEITKPELYFSRRRFLRDASGAMLIATVPGLAWHSPVSAAANWNVTRNLSLIHISEPTRPY